MTVMEERFELASQRILEIEKEKRMPEQFQRYFAENADYLGVLLEEYKWIASGAMREASLQELERHNESCFIDLMGRNYETSYANPDWAYAQLGETFGQLLSAVAAELRSLPAFIYEQDLEGITIRLELFVEIYCAFAESFEETKEAPEYSRIRDIFYWFASDYAELTAEHAIRHTVDWGQRFALDIIENADLSDIRYLFWFGEYIADDQWKLAEHLNGLPEEKIQKIADTYTEGFRKGFELCGMRCVGHCEIDKYADRSYRAIHDVKEDEWYAADITKVAPADLPRADLWAGGFPCQDISVAGRQRGLDGARSGLFFTLAQLVKGQSPENRPTWIVLENVKNLLSIHGGWDFATVLDTLASLG